MYYLSFVAVGVSKKIFKITQSSFVIAPKSLIYLQLTYPALIKSVSYFFNAYIDVYILVFTSLKKHNANFGYTIIGARNFIFSSAQIPLLEDNATKVTKHATAYVWAYIHE